MNKILKNNSQLQVEYVKLYPFKNDSKPIRLKSNQ